MNKPNILIIEDDSVVSKLLGTMMESQDYVFSCASTGRDGMMLTMSHKPDVILLDLGLPDIDGVEIIKRVREWSNVPIIVISAREEEHDKVEALDAGADDYLTKPFPFEELLARLRVALRRVQYDNEKVNKESYLYSNGNLTINYIAGCAYLNGEEIHLTPMEYKLLCLFAKNTGKVLTYNYILKEVWGSINASDIPSLRVFMASLRKKIRQETDSDFIQTHSGVGYRMLRIS